MRLPFGLSPSSASPSSPAPVSSLALVLLLVTGHSIAIAQSPSPNNVGAGGDNRFDNGLQTTPTTLTTTTPTTTTPTTTPMTTAAEATGPTNPPIPAPTSAHFSFTFQQYDVNNENEQGRIIDLELAKRNPLNSSIAFAATEVDAIANFTFISLGLWEINNRGTTGSNLFTNQSPQPDPRMESGEGVVMLTPQADIGKLSVNFNSSTVTDRLNPAYAYYIAIDWLGSNNSAFAGRSYTPYFVFIDGKANMTTATSLMNSTISSLGPVRGDDTPATPSNAVNPQSDASKGKAGGLSIGAIAGIAVGAAAAVLIAMGVMVWMCLARKQGRRQRERPGGVAGVVASRGPKVDTSHDGYDPPPGQGEYVVDKETQPRVVAGSPRLPYSDGMAGPSTRERSFTPYSDPPPVSVPAPPYDDPPTPMQVTPSASPAPHHTAPVAPGRDGGAAPRAGSVTPHGLPRSVAALVEEGMTEEEIRRLEEEEHALDMAIEQAGRGGGR